MVVGDKSGSKNELQCRGEHDFSNRSSTAHRAVPSQSNEVIPGNKTPPPSIPKNVWKLDISC